MANTTIKITQLPSIGNGLSASTILPVVNTSGTAVTEKVTVGAVANFALSQAGNTLQPAFLSTVAYSVSNAAQPNITSLGTLTGLTIGNVANFHVPGGINGYVLQTDGSGNLSWVSGGGSGNGEVGGANGQLQFNNAGSFGGDASLTWDAANAKLNTVNFAASEATIYGNVNAVDVLVTGNVVPNAIYTDHYYYSNGQAFSGGGNGSPGGSNTQVQFNDGGLFGGNTGFTFNKTTGIFSSPFLAGNGNGLSNIQGANVIGAVTYATTANTVAGGNVIGAVQYATTANSVAVANVVGIGNIATLALSGSSSNVLYGNGVFAPVAGSNSSSISNGSSTVNIPTANGDVVINPATTSNVELTTSSLTSVSADCYIGLVNEYVADTEFNDDITVVQVGWTVIVGSTTYTVTAIDPSPPANQYRITVAGATFVSGTNYTFTNPVPVEATWNLDQYGTLNAPGGSRIAADATAFEVQNANAVNFEANTVVNIFTDTNGNAYQWQFGDDGNLTLPSGNPSINYANGTPYGGGGGSGYIIPYEVATFVANTQPGFGEITFCNLEGANSAPSTAQKLFINESPTNEQSLGTIFQQWTSNSYRGTLSLNNGSDSQATFNISNGRIYFEPEVYRGFNAGLNQIWGDDCSINQLIITNASAPNFYNTDFLVEDDVFHASGLATGNTHVMLNIYGSSQYNPINPNDLWNTFVAFVDNVLYDGSTLRTNPDDIKTQFYNNTGSFRNNIPTQDLFQYFRFTSSSDADYFGTAPTTTNGSGTGATVRIRVNPNNTYTVLGTALPGVGYIGGETLTVLGTDLGGATPDNDLTILIDSVDGDGVITAVSYDSGTGVYPWPTNRISDGGDDQYDVGNYLNTNLASEISYANGITQTASAAFGGGDYCVMYYQSFFCMVATGVSSSVTDLFYSGNLGFDGDGALNWTGLRSNQSVIANNNALYAYFDSEYLDGELTPTVGTTYNMTLDSAGINLDGFYAYYDTNTSDTFFGSNTAWRVESQDNLYVQSYNDMLIQTLVNQRGIGETGPTLTVQAGDGSPGQKEINATAGNGGTVNVRGGDAGGSDGIDSLGNTGGSVNITGGVGSGNSQAGNVEINGGEGNNSGSINLRTDYGSNSTGKITLNTGGNGTTNTWEFRPDGSTIFPTLTVDIHNGGNQQAQTLQFGDNTQQAIITGPTPDVTGSAQRLIIQGQRGSGTGEGGDVYLWAGDSDFYGGDIKIYAGDADAVSTGAGGYVNIEGGRGFDLGGYVSMQGGESSNGQGAYAQLVGGYGLSGGFANIVGGQGYAGPGGNVNITGGSSGNGLAEYGNVSIGAGASTWTFDNSGNLAIPKNINGLNNGSPIVIDAGVTGNSYISIPSFTDGGEQLVIKNDYPSSQGIRIQTETGNFVLSGNSITFPDSTVQTTAYTGGGGGGNTGNVTFDDVTVQGVNQLNLSAGPDYTANLAYLQVRAGDVASHIHFDTGNNEAYDLIVGNDSKYVQVSSTGNIIMSSYDGNTSYTMKLDTTGNVTFPGVLGVAGGTATAVPVTNESGIPGGVGGSSITGTVASNPDIASVQPGWTVTGNNLTVTTTVTSVVESSPNFYTITTDTIEEAPFTYNDVYTFTSPGISNWVFANDNTLTFPRDEIANTDPYLRIEGGTNPRILSEDASLAGPANLEITALNTIFTGVTGSEIRIYPDDGEIGSTGNLQLWANAGSNVAQYSWTFDTDGNLTTPSNLVISPSGLGTGTAIAQSDAPLVLASSDANGKASLGWYGNPTGPGNVVQVGLNDSGTGSMTVLTGDFANTTYVWDFDNTGNLTLPTGGNIYYANGTIYGGGGGGSGNSISDGTSNVTVVSTDGNVVIGIDNDVASWTFATDGGIYSKQETDFKLVMTDPNDDGYGLQQIASDGSQDLAKTVLELSRFAIFTNLDGAGEEWRFSGNTLQVSTNSTIRGFDSDVVIESMYAGGNGIASLRSVSNINDPNIFTTIDATTTGANIKVYNGGSGTGTEYTWQFDNNGNLTFPGNNITLTSGSPFIQGAANATIGISSQGENGQVSFDYTVDPANANTSAGVIVMDSNTPGSVNFRIDLAGDINDISTSHIWYFDSTGNLTLPGNTFSVNYANGSQVSIGGGTPAGNNNEVQFNSNGAFTASGNLTFTDTVGGGTVEIGNELNLLGNGTIGTTSGNLLLQPAGNIVMQASASNLVFDITGNLTLPGNTFSINFANGSQAALPSIANGTSNVVVASSGNVTVGVAGTSNVMTVTSTGANVTGTLNTTGNVTAQGTGSNIIRRAFGLVAADTYVTLDDISARVTSSTNQLSLILTSGSWQGTGWTETFTGGTPSVNNWVNLPLSTGYDNASGAMNSQGNGCRCIISDQTPSAKVYQITVVRSGTTGALWNISIERLV